MMRPFSMMGTSLLLRSLLLWLAKHFLLLPSDSLPLHLASPREHFRPASFPAFLTCHVSTSALLRSLPF